MVTFFIHFLLVSGIVTIIQEERNEGKDYRVSPVKFLLRFRSTFSYLHVLFRNFRFVTLFFWPFHCV